LGRWLGPRLGLGRLGLGMGLLRLGIRCWLAFLVLAILLV